MANYLCRWPNGDFSIVNARNKGDAIEMLDEWGNAEQAILSPLTDCMFDFRLSDDGHLELVDVGESTHDCIMETCYPHSRSSGSPLQPSGMRLGWITQRKGASRFGRQLRWSGSDYRAPSRQRKKLKRK